MNVSCFDFIFFPNVQNKFLEKSSWRGAEKDRLSLWTLLVYHDFFDAIW